jgi:Second Messenger Oligonucleotide or Dinucleotide Synthetase domain
MGKLGTRSASHRWLLNFVDWIKPQPETEEVIDFQAEEIRERIKGKATADGLVVRSMPWSGSFAKKTGLRRHMRGDHDVEGQDVDLTFVISPQTTQGEDIDSLLDRFERYANESYPNTRRNPTKSSICLDFKSTKLSYDLVPMLAVEGDDEAQVLLRRDGERRSTSVQKHIEFIRTRTAKSNVQSGRVKFNEGVRLVKWWREMRQARSQVLEDVPSMVIDLLCAKALDEHSVDETYTETLSRWFGRMAHLVRRRKSIDFSDFTSRTGHAVGALWSVLDPVNPDNNVVPPSWKNLELDELAEWFEGARDGMARVIAADTVGDEGEARQELVDLFGNAFKDHGDPA